MSTMIPPVVGPWVKSNAEKRIFQWFKDAKGTEDWIVLHSLNIAEHVRLIHGETDFLVLAPGYGIFALEVKGGGVQRLNGLWNFTDRTGHTDQTLRSPFEQAWDGIHSIVRYIENHAGAGQRHLQRILYGIGVMFPDIPDEYVGIDSARWQVWDQTEGSCVTRFIHRLSAESAQENARLHVSERCRPTAEDVRWLANLLRPDFDLIVPAQIHISRANQALLELTREQYRCLDQLEDNPRCLMLGGAGTGKTLLAIEQARRSVICGKSVGVFCYNNALGEWLRSVLDRDEYKPTYVGTLHGFIRKILSEHGESIIPGADSDEYWRETLPCQATALLSEHTAPFDLIIVDEAQDILSPPFLHLLDASLKRGIARGNWSMYGDFSMQAIYAGNQSADDMIALLEDSTSFVRFRLTLNCRNTMEIADALCTATDFEPPVQPWARIRGPEVKWETWSSQEEQYEKLTLLLSQLLADGVERQDITILSPRKRENSVVAMLKGISVYNWTPTGRRGITFSTVQSFKGMENAVIVLVDITTYTNNKLIYVAMSRARGQLLVLENDEAKHEYDQLFFRRKILQ